MNSIVLRDTVEPSAEDRKSTFGSIDPVAVERALEIAQRLESARKARQGIAEAADEDAAVEA